MVQQPSAELVTWGPVVVIPLSRVPPSVGECETTCVAVARQDAGARCVCILLMVLT